MAQNYPDLVEWIEHMNEIRHDLQDGGDLTDAFNIIIMVNSYML